MAEDTLDVRAHRIVQRLLLAGLIAAFAFLLAGMIIDLVRGSSAAPAVRLFDLARAGVHLGDRVMAIGVLLLALTPAVRVLSLVVLWAVERDWRFVTVAVVVAVTLAISLLLGRG